MKRHFSHEIRTEEYKKRNIQREKNELLKLKYKKNIAR